MSDLVGEYAGALLPAIEIVEKAAKKPMSPEKRESLAGRIKGAVLAYDGTKFMADYASKITVHDIAAPLAEVIEVLEDDEVDGHAVLVALGAPQHMTVSPDRESLDWAVAEREFLLHLLRKLRANLPPAPAKPSRGRPTARDLYQLIERLADCWELWTGKEFKRLWGKGKPFDAMRLGPATDAMHFICAVVKVIDKDRLGELPTITKNVVADRRKRQIWQRYEQENPESAFWGPPPKIVVESKRGASKRGTFR
jgi:hypothetical protein